MHKKTLAGVSLAEGLISRCNQLPALFRHCHTHHFLNLIQLVGVKIYAPKRRLFPLDFLRKQSVTDDAATYQVYAKSLPELWVLLGTRPENGSGLTPAEAIMKQCTANMVSTDSGVLPPVKTSGGKTVSKKDRLVRLLSNPKGARVLSLCKSLGWQKHTVRAAISGLRTSGYAIETYASSKDGVTVYRITGKPNPEVSV